MKRSIVFVSFFCLSILAFPQYTPSRHNAYICIGNLFNRVTLTNEIKLDSNDIFGVDVSYYWDVFPGFKTTTYISHNIKDISNPTYLQAAFLFGMHDMHPYIYKYGILPKSKEEISSCFGAAFSLVKPGIIFKHNVLCQLTFQAYFPSQTKALSDPGYRWAGVSRAALWYTTFAGNLAYIQIKWKLN